MVGSSAPLSVRFGPVGQIRVLNYHRINRVPPDFQFDADVVSASPELFDREVQFCRSHFDVISFADLGDVICGAARLPKRPLMITFDDGYEDNYSHAYPILKRHGLKGMFFLAADYIGTGRLFWWDQVAFAFKSCHLPSVNIQVADTRREFDVSTVAAQRTSIAVMLRLLKTVTNAERLRVLDEIATTTHLTESLAAVPRQAMTWAEAREMAQNGMEIGSHTRSHPILSQVVDADALADEIVGSKAIIEREVASPVSVFSYPVGGRQTITDTVKEVVRRAGYKFAVTYINGFNRLSSETDFFALKRLHVDGLDESEFRMRLVAPHL
jgi:peptidoglycan/xylan/chitin deacetylase (PgdA/CDA1 family)